LLDGRRNDQSEICLPRLPHALERRRSRHPHSEGSQDRVREVAMNGTRTAGMEVLLVALRVTTEIPVFPYYCRPSENPLYPGRGGDGICVYDAELVRLICCDINRKKSDCEWHSSQRNTRPSSATQVLRTRTRARSSQVPITNFLSRVLPHPCVNLR